MPARPMLIIRGKWRRRIIGLAGAFAFAVAPWWRSRGAQPPNSLIFERRYDTRLAHFIYINCDFGDAPRDTRVPTAAELAEQRRRDAEVVIEDNIDRDSWRRDGHTGATLEWIEDDLLLVRQTRANHESLASLLDLLSRTQIDQTWLEEVMRR
jgi:hypothetical protein